MPTICLEGICIIVHILEDFIVGPFYSSVKLDIPPIFEEPVIIRNRKHYGNRSADPRNIVCHDSNDSSNWPRSLTSWVQHGVPCWKQQINVEIYPQKDGKWFYAVLVQMCWRYITNVAYMNLWIVQMNPTFSACAIGPITQLANFWSALYWHWVWLYNGKSWLFLRNSKPDNLGNGLRATRNIGNKGGRISWTRMLSVR